MKMAQVINLDTRNNMLVLQRGVKYHINVDGPEGATLTFRERPDEMSAQINDTIPLFSGNTTWLKVPDDWPDTCYLTPLGIPVMIAPSSKL